MEISHLWLCTVPTMGINSNLSYKDRATMTDCTACEKGLVFFIEAILSENEDRIKKLSLCRNCRAVINSTLKESERKKK